MMWVGKKKRKRIWALGEVNFVKKETCSIIWDAGKGEAGKRKVLRGKSERGKDEFINSKKFKT